MIEQLLSSQLQTGRHPPLYLVEPVYFQPDAAELISWTHQLLQQTYPAKKIDLINNPDILLLTPEGAQFKTGQLERIFTFLHTKALTFGQKIIIITDVSALTPYHQHKLLKILEEPPVSACFIFLNPRRIKLLDTVLSRAQRVRATSSQLDLGQIAQDLTRLKTLPLIQLQEELKSDWIQIRALLEYLSIAPISKIQAAAELSDLYQLYQTDLTLHNSSQFICYKLHHWLQKYSA